MNNIVTMMLEKLKKLFEKKEPVKTDRVEKIEEKEHFLEEEEWISYYIS